MSSSPPPSAELTLTCLSLRAQTYGLIAPGVEMADVLAFNLTQTDGHAPRKMNDPDLSTKLKLMGVDVASFGDYFADERMIKEIEAAEAAASAAEGVQISSSKPSKRKAGPRSTKNDPIRCLTYHDPFSATYSKLIFSADGQYLLGGILIGDTSSFVKMVSLIKKKKKLAVPPSEFIIGAKKSGEDDGGDLDDDAVICSCHVSGTRQLFSELSLTLYSALHAVGAKGSYWRLHQERLYRLGRDQEEDQGRRW